jgi:hypothetical protein
MFRRKHLAVLAAASTLAIGVPAVAVAAHGLAVAPGAGCHYSPVYPFPYICPPGTPHGA